MWRKKETPQIPNEWIGGGATSTRQFIADEWNDLAKFIAYGSVAEIIDDSRLPLFIVRWTDRRKRSGKPMENWFQPVINLWLDSVTSNPPSQIPPTLYECTIFLFLFAWVCFAQGQLDNDVNVCELRTEK